MNRQLRKNVKTDFEKYFFKLMNKILFGKTMENVRKHRNLVSTKERRNRLMSEPKYHNAIFFFRKFMNHKSEMNTGAHKKTCLFRSINNRNQ